MEKSLLTSKLRPEVREFFVRRREALLLEMAQIERLLSEDDERTFVGMPMFAVHGAQVQRAEPPAQQPSGFRLVFAQAAR